MKIGRNLLTNYQRLVANGWSDDMNCIKYNRILNNINKYAPLECGVQALVFMLLDEVAEEKYKGKKVLVAVLRDNEGVFGGIGGVPDLCVVNTKFEYISTPMKEVEINDAGMEKSKRLLQKYDAWVDEMKQQKDEDEESVLKRRKAKLNEINNDIKNAIKKQKENRLGCVELKAINKKFLDHIKQVAGHIIEYKKVLYTDGLRWEYYCPSKEQYDKIISILGIDKEFEVSKSERELADCKTEIRRRYGERLKGVRLTRENIEKLKTEINSEDIEICDAAIKAIDEIKKRQIDKHKLEEILQDILKNPECWSLSIGSESEKIKIDENQYKLLCENLKSILW